MQVRMTETAILAPHHRELDPPAALKSAIKCFWYDRREANPLSQLFEVLPDGYAEIIFHVGGMEQLPSPFLMGLLNQPVTPAANATVRTLERKFKQSSGHAVKAVCGLMRFEQVRNTLFHRPHENIAGLAHALGYVDQSHLSREFKRYTGTTPAAFARRQPRGDVGGFIQV
jgi:hypothetical protein